VSTTRTKYGTIPSFHRLIVNVVPSQKYTALGHEKPHTHYIFLTLEFDKMGGSGGQRSRSKPRVASAAAVKEVSYKLEALADEELRKWSIAYGYPEKVSRASLLEQLNGHADGILDPCRSAGVKNLPLAMPPFTLSQIQAAIPRHCFKRR